MWHLRALLADLLLRLSLWIRPEDCISGTGWAVLPEYHDKQYEDEQ